MKKQVRIEKCGGGVGNDHLHFSYDNCDKFVVNLYTYEKSSHNKHCVHSFTPRGCTRTYSDTASGRNRNKELIVELLGLKNKIIG